MSPLTVKEVEGLDEEAFVRRFGGVYEHSPWAAREAWRRRPFVDFDGLAGAFAAAVRDASDDARLALVRAHPELGGREARDGDLTAESAAEQAGAGLDRLADDAAQRLQALNHAYREKFGFPLVIAVRGQDTPAILARAQARLDNSPEEELANALDQIDEIARLRLRELVSDGRPDGPVTGAPIVTTHVLDAARGRPAANVPVRLERRTDGQWRALAAGHTDGDGRCRDLAVEDPSVGAHRLVFDTGAYFAASGQPAFYPEVIVTFEVAPREHYHVPLLLSPFSYTTYRGS
jgi:2-oxo-4-hydroxy-4-carboxy-5-ureidoimidazoline decarboxylase